ncbi:MAG: phosphoribosylamine--glycine ligase [Planctomycetota bacterium]
MNDTTTINVLVVGSGGREHALAWKISQSPRCGDLFVAPGNAGTAIDAKNVDLDVSDHAAVVLFCQEHAIGLAVIGPEAPLVAGLADDLETAGIPVFGPSATAAELEGSKVFCKDILQKATIPTAEYQAFRSADDAAAFIRNRYDDESPNQPCPVVVKADGLAAGKGVIVCSTKSEALDAIQRIGGGDEFGDAGNKLIIEERLVGEEASVLAITDGKSILVLPPAQDHKPAYDDDKGPNTGGMGAYSPAPIVDADLLEQVEDKVLVRIVHAMKRDRRPFRGILYAGLMITAAGPKVLEFNVRFGDPECQPILMRLKSDLLEILLAVAEQRLDEIDDASLQWDDRPSVCVVMASEGYPGPYEKGRVIRGLEDAAKLESQQDVKVFHAGTKLDSDGNVVTSGGRVLGITAMGDSIADAKRAAYTAVRKIRWQGAWCRKDIGNKAFKK